jgi:predicted RNase H-related nuclease YkuK (DUF458 family)
MTGGIKQSKFYNPTKGYLTPEEVVEEIFHYLDEKPEKFYEIVVGCDSSSGKTISFPVAIVVLRQGAGGRFFLNKIRYPQEFNKRFKNIYYRVLNEVLISCEIALELKKNLEEEIKKRKKDYNFRFQYIHADIGEEGKTKDMIKEVIGLIKSNGFEAKIKPHSFAASIIADRYT